MHKLKNILVLMSIVTLFLACEKEEAGYTPQIATYNELQYEIGRQVKSAGSYNSVLDSTVVKSVFSTYLDLLNETNNHLSYLQIYVNNLVTNEQDATLRERYNKVKAELDINVAKWKTAAANYGEFKSRNIIPVYLAFNSMKLFLYSPNFSDNFATGKFQANYSILEKTSGFQDLAYFKQRTDFNFVIQAGRSLNDIVKISNYVTSVLPTYNSRTFQSMYEVNKTKIQQNLVLVLGISNAETLFNLYLKKGFDNVTTGQQYDYTKLLGFGVNLDNIFELIKSYAVFADNRLLFIASPLDVPGHYTEIAQALNRIKSIPDGLILVQTYYGIVYPNAAELLFFANNVKAITEWQLNYNNCLAKTTLLYQKYKAESKITTVQDIDDVNVLIAARTALENSYLSNENNYGYFVGACYLELTNDISEEALGWMLKNLQSKLPA